MWFREERSEWKKIQSGIFSEILTHASLCVQAGGLLRVLGKMTDVVVRLFSIIFKRLCRLRKVPNNWRKVNVVPIFRKGKKEGLGVLQVGEPMSLVK